MYILKTHKIGDMNLLLVRYRNPFLLALLLAVLVTIVVSDFKLFPITFHKSLAAAAELADTMPATPAVPMRSFIEIENSCGIHFEGDCVVARARPATTSAAVAKLRNGIVLEVASTSVTDDTGLVWYHVIFDESVRYPERLWANWYVAAENARLFEDIGPQDLDQSAGVATSTKHIIVSRSKQMLYAYDGDTLFLETPVSTGLDLTPTPRGTFHIYRKTPSRYMQGPLPGVSDQYYDLPGVPWDLYFTEQGGAIHGAYWHNSFGEQWSHGCVNLPLDVAHKLYDWADVGVEVLVQD